MIKIDVGKFIHKPMGSRDDLGINDFVNFGEGEGINLTKPVTAKAQLLKLPHEINVQIKDMRSEAQCTCARCLRVFDYAVQIPMASREFIIDLPSRDLARGEDVYYVDKLSNEIDLEPMLKEEILLHFPEVTVCSESCKGLCDKCGVNLNEKACNCVHDAQPATTPFRFL